MDRLDRAVLTSCLLTIMALPILSAYSIAHEGKLQTDLLTGYVVGVRPESTVTVQTNFQLTSIIDVDLKGQILSISGWWLLRWNDSRLTWNNADYGGIAITTLYEHQIWKPALVVSNSLTDLSAIQEETIPLRVKNLGVVVWQPPGILKVSCEMDPTYFPFDTQYCTIQVTSFGFTLDEVSLQSSLGILMYYYQESGEWEVASTSVSVDSYQDDNLNYGRVSFNMTLKRRPGFYWLNVIFPVIVNGILAMFLFLLPAESGEKMGYSLTVLLTYVVLMTLLSGGMPTSAKHTSLLEVYISLILGMSGVAILLAILNLAIYHTDEDRPVPAGVKVAIIRLSSMCCLGSWPSERDKTADDAALKSGQKKLRSNSTTVHPYTEADTRIFKKSSMNTFTTRHMGPSNSEETDSNKYPEVTWKHTAAVMDTLCFRVYLVVILSLTLIFMPMLMYGAS